MPGSVLRVTALLFGSGFCALVYQIAWLRELRLVFGASTAASAAVLAIFMGGLGLGGAILGRRADESPNPLRMYGRLELLIAVTAAASPFLLEFVRFIYTSLGGSLTLGAPVAMVARLALSTLVLGVPTFLMGGTLPAAAKSVETDEDLGRGHLAYLYSVNTLGAVTGACLVTFVLLEHFGTRSTLWLACLANVFVAFVALALAGGAARSRRYVPKDVPEQSSVSILGEGYILASAAVVGFTFFSHGAGLVPDVGADSRGVHLYLRLDPWRWRYWASALAARSMVWPPAGLRRRCGRWR